MSHSSLPPAELFRLCVEGDDSAWEEFLRRYSRIIYWSLHRFLDRLPKDIIEEEFQQFLLKLIEGRVLARYKVKDNVAVEAWLHTLARNYTVDRYRFHKRQETGPDARPATADTEEPPLGDDADGSRVRIETLVVLNECEAYLAQELPEATCARDLLVFRAYYREGQTAKDIGQMQEVGLTTEGVESIIGRIGRLLRDRIKK